MAYTTSKGVKIPSAFDNLVLPLILAFKGIGDAAAVAGLKERVKALSVPVESDEYAHLRLRGTHEHLGRLVAEAGKRSACPEFLSLLEQLREGVARRHDALPANPEFPRAKLAKPAPGSVAEWAEAADKAALVLEAPVRNDGEKTTAGYAAFLED